jgi:hypothetical protein
MSPPKISEVVFTDPDTVRDVIHNFNRDGFDALYPRYRGGHPQTFTLPTRQEIKRIALSDPRDLDQPLRAGVCRSSRTTWSLRGWSRTSSTRGYVSSCARRHPAPNPSESERPTNDRTGSDT